MLMKHSKKAPWRNSMEEEMKCILENKTWELATLPAVLEICPRGK